MAKALIKDKSLDSRIWDAGCPIRGVRDAPLPIAATTRVGLKEEEKLYRIVNIAGLKNCDYNISPSRYIHTSAAETFWPRGLRTEKLIPSCLRVNIPMFPASANPPPISNHLYESQRNQPEPFPLSNRYPIRHSRVSAQLRLDGIAV